MIRDSDVGIFNFNLRGKNPLYCVSVASDLVMGCSGLAGLQLEVEKDCTGNPWGCVTLVG